MKKKLTNLVVYIIFLAFGVYVFWKLYQDTSIDELKAAIKGLKWRYILFSILVSSLSNISRAIRWNMLIKPLGYKPSTLNSFLSVMVMYLVNIGIPRGGEVARCSVLTKYHKIPFTKLVGTVVVERVSDVVALLVFALAIVLSQLNTFKQFFIKNTGSEELFTGLFSTKNIVLAVIVIIIGIGLLVLFRKKLAHTKLYAKLTDLWSNFVDGLKSILKLKNKWLYIGHTAFIYLMWFLSLYFVFFSFQPTEHLGINPALLALVMGALAMTVPVPAGIGPYHFMIASTLVLYGIEFTDGKDFALIIHSVTNLSLAILGVISLLILPAINKSKNEDAAMTS